MIIPQYPQRIFSKSIIDYIKQNNISGKIFVDMPCGNGETSYYFAKYLPYKIEAFDLNEQSILNAKRKFSDGRVKFAVGNIFDILEGLQNVDILCVINSFFLLPDRELLLESINKAMTNKGHVFFIIPNVKSKNYLNFKKLNSKVNQVELLPEEFELKIKSHGIEPVLRKGICYANIYGRKELKYFSRLAPYYLSFLNVLMTAFRVQEPSYYLIVGTVNK